MDSFVELINVVAVFLVSEIQYNAYRHMINLTFQVQGKTWLVICQQFANKVF